MLGRIRSFLWSPAVGVSAGATLVAFGLFVGPFLSWFIGPPLPEHSPPPVVGGTLEGRWPVVECVDCATSSVDLIVDVGEQPIPVIQGVPFVLELKVTPATHSERVDHGKADFFSARVSLHVAGAEISPETPLTVTRESSIKWSVRINDVGDAAGFVHFAGLQGLEELPADFFVGWPSQDVIQFDVQPNTAGMTFQETYGAPAAVGLGLIISVSSIIRFFWAWLDRRRARKLEEKERLAREADKKPKVIID